MKSRVIVHGAWLMVTVTAALLGALVFGGSCGGERDKAGARSVTQLADPNDVIDEKLMIALAQAKNFHDKAKVYMLDGKSAEAIAAVRQILSLQFPPGAPEADDVRSDARALLAKLLADQNQLDEAMRVVEEGLATATRDSFFVANLHTVKGEIHYKRAGTYPDPKDPKAIEEKHLAIDSFDRSIKINEKIQKELEKP
jgi:tetratricopeptide (TPR) repeat protein